MTQTILLVDDNPSNLSILYKHLNKLGYHVVVSDNGIDAVERVATAPPDLVLLDVRMPGMDGFETCRAIKASSGSANVPIIFLSAVAETDDRLRGFAAGGVDYIAKPINVEEVTARVQIHLALARLRRELQEANALLEHKVEQQTAKLQAEVQQRKQQHAEKEMLLTLVSEQNQQLYQFTSSLLEARPVTQLSIFQTFNTQIQESLIKIARDLQTLHDMLHSLSGGEESFLPTILVTQQRVKHLQNYLHHVTVNNEKPTTLPSSSTPIDALTEREQDVLRMLADGLSTSEIGERLHISDITVRSFRTRIMRKLGINHFAGLVKLAVRHNLSSLYEL